MINGGLMKIGLIKMEKKCIKWGYNINGIDRQGRNRNRYNINGYSNSGYDSQNYNINGYNTPTWKDAFDVPDGSYSMAALQNYFECIIKKHETTADVYPVLIYANEINNRVVFKIKSGYKLVLLSKETMKLLGSSVDITDGDKNSELVPQLESVDLVLVHCNLVNNSYQQASKVLYTFVPNKKYGQLITVSPETLIMLKTVNTEFSFIEIWFTDHDNRPLEIEDSVNISLIIGIGNFM